MDDMEGGGTGGAGPAAAASAAAAISRTRSPGRDVTSGAIGRLLQRTASLTTTKRSKRIPAVTALTKRLSVSSADDEGRLLDSPSPRAAMALAAPHQWPSRAPTDAGDITQPQPQQLCAKPTATEIEMPSATPQPQLQRRASFRDRLNLKGWHKTRPPAESTPRTVYVPKHAAADFSRMPVSPLSASRQRQPMPMPTLTEDGTPARPRLNGQGRPPHSDEAARSRQQRDEESAAKRHYRTRSGPELHSYPMVDDPVQASTAAVHVPINSQPTVWSMGEPSPAAPSAHPPSDYEVFLARAEAEEREQYLRLVYQRSAAYAYSSSHVNPDPHRQFATPAAAAAAAAAGSSSAADRAHRWSTSGNRHVLNSNGGEAQRQQDAATKNRAAARVSWTPSYDTDGSETEKLLPEGKKLAVPARQAKPQAPAAPAQQRQPHQKQQTQRPSVDGGDEELRRSREYKPPAASGMLRRQGSFKKRFVEYIRPPKTVWQVQRVVE